jgi:DNA (cytosine-5)-methyltransferase 1
LFTFIDLFCGAGGFTEGFLLAGDGLSGFQLVAASDVSPMTRLTYEGRFRDQLHLPHSYVATDATGPGFADSILQAVIEATGAATVDVICGGPPCQGFSVFGARNEHDPRNDLSLSYLQVIEKLQPRYFVMENVVGLVKMYNGKAVQRLRGGVSSLSGGYTLAGPIKINAADFGVPQIRERVLFIGARSDMPPIACVPPTHEPSSYVTVGQAIGDLAFLRPWETAGAYDPGCLPQTAYQRESRRGRLFAKLGIAADPTLHNHEAARHTPAVLARFSVLRKGQGLESVPRLLWERHLKTKKKWAVRLDDGKPSYTVVTIADDLVHSVWPRTLTVRELARLQSFDDTFVFMGPRATGGGGAGNRKRAVEVPQFSQVGNAVPPLMAKGIAAAILRVLGQLTPADREPIFSLRGDLLAFAGDIHSSVPS